MEDVKTVYRLTPLLLAAFGVSFTLEMNDQLGLHAILTTKITFMCVQNLKRTVFYITPVILIPFYRFILYPLVHKYVPSILKIMGMGLSLCLLVTVIELNLLSIGHFYSNASHCIFDDLTVTGTLPIPLYWVLIIDFVNGVGVVLVMCSMFEMVIAQTPNRMRGIMMGLIVMLGFGTNAIFANTISAIQQPVPGDCSSNIQ